MKQPNWFLAFPLDGAFAAALPPPPAHFRTFHPEDLHVTLAFLGGCGEPAARRAWEVLGGLVAREGAGPIPVSLAEVVPLGPPRAYSALAALLGQGRAEAEALLGAWRDPLSDAAGARRETRDPKAHATLARPMRQASDEERRRGVAWAEGLDLRGVRGVLDRIALYTWSEARGERLFRVVEEAPLAS